MMLVKDGSDMLPNRQYESCFVPAYGFEDPRKAMKYSQKPRIQEGNGFANLKKPVAMISCGDRIYVPRINLLQDYWSMATLLKNTNGSREDRKRIWRILRSRDDSMPISAYNVALLVQGPRKFFRLQCEKEIYSGQQHRIAEGEKQCYVVWGKKDGPMIRCAKFVDNATRIFVLRSGRGVVYSREIKYDANDRFAGFCDTLTCIEFSIHDNDPTKGDVLEFKTFRVGSLLDGLDKVWTILIKRARAGFQQWCKPM